MPTYTHPGPAPTLQACYDALASIRQQLDAIEAQIIAMHPMKPSITEENSLRTVEIIKRLVANRFGIQIAEITAKRRPEYIAWPRQIAMALARKHTILTLSDIGTSFGGLNHGTVMHAERLVRDRASIHKNVAAILAQLSAQIAEQIKTAPATEH